MEHDATFIWADGHVTYGRMDPDAGEVQIPGPDGHYHAFTSANEVDDHGRDVYREQDDSQ